MLIKLARRCITAWPPLVPGRWGWGGKHCKRHAPSLNTNLCRARATAGRVIDS